MFAHTGKTPAVLIKEFRKTSDKPVLKAAYVEGCVYVGDNQLDTLDVYKRQPSGSSSAWLSFGCFVSRRISCCWTSR